MAPALELALHERLALGAGGLLQLGGERRKLFALRGDLRRLENAVEGLVEALVGRLVALIVERPVPYHRVQPRPEPADFRSTPQRVVWAFASASCTTSSARSAGTTLPANDTSGWR
jgi:hypothetical protein